MLSFLKRKPKPPVEEKPVAFVECPVIEPEPELPASERRMRQQNIKATEDCCVAFDAIAKAAGMSKAALFEDMVAERYEALQRQGMNLEGSAG